MKIENERDGFLTDYEVLKHIDSIKSSRVKADKEKQTKSSPKSENLETVLIELHSYLRDRPAGNENQPQNSAAIAEFMTHVRKFQLEKIEVLQLINVAPRSLPVLYNVVEECDQRFSAEEMDEILELVEKYLGYEPQPEKKEEMEE